jgi:tetraprenyl-beta-curcumene synthase
LSVAPVVRRQIQRWEQCATRIADPELQRLALGKLRDERFNIEVAAMVATTAPASHRKRTTEAIVALQVIYDYLDALTERPTADPIRDGLHQSEALIDAVTCSGLEVDYYAFDKGQGDAGYLDSLVAAVRDAVATLPAARVIRELIPRSAERCAQAQVRIHATPVIGIEQLRAWATEQAGDTDLQWREWLFGAVGSVVAAHALIALAADQRATHRHASDLDDVYMSLCAVATLLDHLVDHDVDTQYGRQNYLDFYRSRDELNDQLTAMTSRVVKRSHGILNGAHHVMILAGVVAYYTSQSSATHSYAKPVTDHVRDEMRPLITPMLATLHLWRLAKRLRAGRQTPRLSNLADHAWPAA